MYTDEQIRIISILRKNNVAWKIIAECLEKKPGAVREWWSQNRINIGMPPKVVIKKSKIDGKMGLAIKKLGIEKPNLALRDYKAELVRQGFAAETIPGKSTINLFQQRNEIRILKFRKANFISQKNIQKRLEFAKKWSLKLHPLIYETIWSDETTVRKAPKSKELFVRCHSSIKQKDLPINYQFQQGGFSVMFWGCFSVFGLGPLVALEGNQNQHTYVDLLEEFLIPEIRYAKDEFDSDMIFMQDNAPCHKTKKVMEFLANNEVQTLDWPPQSPDINPIENLWSIMKCRRQKKYGMPKTKVDLINQFYDIWEELDGELLEKLCESVERRLDAVIRFNGGHSGY